MRIFVERRSVGMVTRTISCAVLSVGFLLISVIGSPALAQETRGIKYSNLSVSPYVNLEYMYDSNIDYNEANNSDSILTVSPGVDLTYTGNEWGLSGNAWYAYDKYVEYSELDEDRYGESLRFYREAAKGWRFVLDESYIKSSQNDSISDGGQGIWRDREQFELKGALSYQLSERTGITLSGMYSDLSYVNDGSQYQPLYGWTEWSTGLELARKLTEKSNLLVSGSYQEYVSDGAKKTATQQKSVDDSSTGYTLMAGLGSRATERINYRALTGVSIYDYSSGDQLTGWTYSLDANWVINRKLGASISGSSYFQPSETEANQAMQVYALSTGLTYRPMRKLTTRFDIAFRREDTADNDGAADTSFSEDLYSIRARADYQLNRSMSIYSGLEYEEQLSDQSDMEFDRYRGTVGLNFRY